MAKTPGRKPSMDAAGSARAWAKEGRLSAALLALAVSLPLAVAAGASQLRLPPPYMPPPKGSPSFFVTSHGLGKGADLGGLAGADRHCQALASAAGLPAGQWRAYLSTQPAPGARAVNARDRIGKGPWFNVAGFRIATDLGDLHGDTLAAARRGNLVAKISALTERGEAYPGEGAPDSAHDILTGTQADGRAYRDDVDHTCSNWTNGSDVGSAQVGHSDRDSRTTSISWNSSHETLGCSAAKLQATGSRGLFYCFRAGNP